MNNITPLIQSDKLNSDFLLLKRRGGMPEKNKCDYFECTKGPMKYSNWAWAVAQANYDWMDSHSTFINYD